MGGVGGVKALNVAEDDEGVRLDNLGHNGGEGVVIPHLDFIGSHCVVLVYHRNGPHAKEGFKGIADVLAALRVVQAVPGQQHLAHGVVVFGKIFVVQVHQLTLAHRGGSLLAGDALGPLPHPQLPHPHADGPGGDQHQLPVGVFDV